MIDDLHELLALRGHEVTAIQDGDIRGFSVTTDEGPVRIAFKAESDAASLPNEPAVVLALEHTGGAPDGVTVLELLARRVHGPGGVVADSVREFCRKRGIRFEPGPWRYRKGLV
jgi:hypothetical protein